MELKNDKEDIFKCDLFLQRKKFNEAANECLEDIKFVNF